MKKRFLCLLFVVCTVISARANSTDSLALTPPMGWNVGIASVVTLMKNRFVRLQT